MDYIPRSILLLIPRKFNQLDHEDIYVWIHGHAQGVQICSRETQIKISLCLCVSLHEPSCQASVSMLHIFMHFCVYAIKHMTTPLHDECKGTYIYCWKIE